MEVHAHSHTPRKRWTHYFWEFIMLFLAVFCGFLAENFREHKVERHRENEFIHSLGEDIRKDTATIRSGINMLNSYIDACDSLSSMIQNGRTTSTDEVRKIYQYNISALAGYLVSLVDRTAVQLKNSGSMRLITNKKAVDAIIDYWKGDENIRRIGDDLHDYRVKAREKSYLLFDNKYYAKNLVDGQLVVQGSPVLMINDYISLTEFSNRVNHIKNLLKLYIQHLDIQHKKADSLMFLLDEEY